jgi:hypothetical protein
MATSADASHAVRMAVEPERDAGASVNVIRDAEGELLALSSDSQVWFAPSIEMLETDHPRWRFAAMLSLVAALMQEGDHAQPYDRDMAAYYARYILIPTETFEFYAHAECDARLAERFNVPLDQIALKRRDLAVARDP